MSFPSAKDRRMFSPLLVDPAAVRSRRNSCRNARDQRRDRQTAERRAGRPHDPGNPCAAHRRYRRVSGCAEIAARRNDDDRRALRPDGASRHRGEEPARALSPHPRRRLVDRRARPERSAARTPCRCGGTHLRVDEIPARAGKSLSGRPRRLRGGGAVDRARGHEALRREQARDRRRVSRRTSLRGYALAAA